MCTTQKYNDRANYAPSLEPAVNNQPLSPSTDAERLADYQQTADRIQTSLLQLADEFCGYHATNNPVTAINELLYHWLSTPVVDLAAQPNQNRLRMGLELVNFLTALNVHLKDLHFFNQQVEALTQQAGKEVSHES